jgi:hydrogenase/urease accessory protein HupE
LGVDHILFGFDHLLFVLALVILVRDWGRVALTVTAFTIAHSITLAAATLGFVNVPGPPVEATIALSIMLVSVEILNARGGKPSLTARLPWLVAFSFGLLHGFGFAGALTEVGLPQHAIPVALLFFNLGFEIGQLAFVAAVLTAGGLWAHPGILCGMEKQDRQKPNLPRCSKCGTQPRFITSMLSPSEGERSTCLNAYAVINLGRRKRLEADHAAARSSFASPRATIFIASSDNGRWSDFASSHGARSQTSRSSSVVKITGIALGWIGSTTTFGAVGDRLRLGATIAFEFSPDTSERE